VNPPKAPTESRLVRVASVADVPPGWALTVTVGFRELALANCDGVLFAVDNGCSHAGGPLGDSRLKEGCYLECPWHNSVFDARTGGVLRGPARKPVRTYDVTVNDGEIFITLD
jgi:3-phenylpropionate/trans-cinnamate dioxygenase ferredoxin subunit